ncbi:MAG: ATP synthase F1 subunit epsilon [Chloroflexi bacterium]|nr:ATP synthase F1 subunit epsilon [Chloroflexota bacterium]
MTIRCEIVSQDKIVFQGEAEMVVLPGSAGEMGILPHHAPLLTVLNYGIISVKVAGYVEHFTVAGGIAEVQPDQVTVLADAAENVKEIDFQRALDARQRSEERLKDLNSQDKDRYMLMMSALKKSNLRLQAVKKYRADFKNKDLN